MKTHIKMKSVAACDHTRSVRKAVWNSVRAILLTLVLALPCLETQAAPPPGYTLAWEDTFAGSTLNAANWTIGLRDPGTGDLVPGAAGNYLLNSEYAGYITADDVVVSGGSLNLLNQQRNYTGNSPKGSFSYTSGWVMSMHKVHFNKGYIEWRARFPSGAKVWPAFWLIAEDLVWGPEWDCFEYFGYRSDVGYDNMGLHLLYNTYPNQQWDTAWIPNYDVNFDCEAWHVYGFEWTPDYARWTIDGVEYRFLANTIGSLWPNEQMYIVMNNGVRSSSPMGSTVWPNNLEIDYVQLYQTSEPTGPTTTHVASIVCSTTAGSKVKGKATVTIQNDLGQPVANATVTGTFSGGYNQTVSGVTAANGTVVLQTTARANKSGLQYTFCVNNVVHGSLTYAPAENVETCDQY